MALLSVINITIQGYIAMRTLYDLYCDAHKIKRYYRDKQKILDQYRVIQAPENLSESIYQKAESEFVVVPPASGWHGRKEEKPPDG